MQLTVRFTIDKPKIIFFMKLLGIKKNISVNTKNATLNLIRIRKEWLDGEIFFKNTLKELFKNFQIPDQKIQIVVFPLYFYLGAGETKKGLVLFGQPLRTKHFASAIIMHEMTHILLSKINIKRPIIIDEIICLLLENYVYSSLDNKSLKDVWKMREMDKFHKEALRMAMQHADNFKINKTAISCLIKKLSNLEPKILTITPPVGLINNLRPQRK